MTKDLWIDLGDFAKAFRKEVPPHVDCNVKNLVGTALKEGKSGKSRFELLTARVENLPYDSHLHCKWVPIMIRAIQGHSQEALKKAGRLFANDQIAFCVDNVSAFAGVGAIEDIPEVAYHRKKRPHPGGGDTVNFGRACMYLPENRFGADGYRSDSGESVRLR